MHTNRSGGRHIQRPDSTAGGNAAYFIALIARKTSHAALLISQHQKPGPIRRKRAQILLRMLRSPQNPQTRILGHIQRSAQIRLNRKRNILDATRSNIARRARQRSGTISAKQNTAHPKKSRRAKNRPQILRILHRIQREKKTRLIGKQLREITTRMRFNRSFCVSSARPPLPHSLLFAPPEKHAHTDLLCPLPHRSPRATALFGRQTNLENILRTLFYHRQNTVRIFEINRHIVSICSQIYRLAARASPTQSVT